MKRATGIGGTFIMAKVAPARQAGHRRHLGIDVQAWGWRGLQRGRQRWQARSRLPRAQWHRHGATRVEEGSGAQWARSTTG